MTDTPSRRGVPRLTDAALRLAGARQMPRGPASAPSPAEHAAALRHSAKAASAHALETGCPRAAGAALALRSEAAVAGRVAGWVRPASDGDCGPNAPGRGGLEAGCVGVMTYSAREGAMVPTTTRVVRRQRSDVLAGLPADERTTAERFEALVAELGAVRCVDPSAAPVGGRSSDGGAAGRWEADRRRADCYRAIGDVAVLKGRNASAHADRRRPITARHAVEGICVRGWSVRKLLGRHGWSRRAAHEAAVIEGLRAALRRIMQVIG